MLLIDTMFLSQSVRKQPLSAQYKSLKDLYDSGATYILQNNVSVFGPFPCAIVPWDISEAQKIAIYNSEVTKVLNWINSKIVINIASIDYKTLDVLIRIATGMLNKCNIPKKIQIMFHDNMVRNLQAEYTNIILSDLPF